MSAQIRYPVAALVYVDCHYSPEPDRYLGPDPDRYLDPETVVPTGPMLGPDSIEASKPVYLGSDNSKAERKDFLRALLLIQWLPKSVRNAVLEELGVSPREHQRRKITIEVADQQHRINEAAKRMRQSGKGRSDKIMQLATEEVARREDIEPESLQRRLRRQRKARAKA